jgi:Fe-S oxidoreductase
MCPSYKATRDRRFSPKGRASLVREWIRLLAEQGVDPREETRRRRGGHPALSIARRAWNSLNPANRRDFSHEVRAAMDTCLACKACAGQCPVKVNVPAFRSKFLELYYDRYLRPLKDPLVAAIETTLPWMARIRPLYNLAVATWPGRAVLRIVGLTALPRLPTLSLSREAARREVPEATLEAISRLSPEVRSRVVVFVTDAFTAHFDPTVALAAFSLARKMSFIPYRAAPHSNGKAMHVHGYLKDFDTTARKTARYLDSLAALGVTIVGIDPSMTLTFRSEYMTVSADPLSAKVLLPQEWLAAHARQLSTKLAVPAVPHQLMVHCTERTNAPASVSQWSTVFSTIGITLEIPHAGCCGMAGTFGHEVRNRTISEKLYTMSWRERVLDTQMSGAVLMATGYSCRSQIKEIDRRSVPHPLQVIDGLTKGNR